MLENWKEDRNKVIEKLFNHLDDGDIITSINYTGISKHYNSKIFEVYTECGFIYIVVLNDEHTVEKYSAEEID